MKITKVYTRTGDEGMTSLVGGTRVSKTHPRVEAYGTVDELSSHLGLLAAYMDDGDDKLMIERIQNNLFGICSYLATATPITGSKGSDKLPATEIKALEDEIDGIMAMLPEKQGFILPGGTVAAAQTHVCRTVCRRAERCIVALAMTTEIAPEMLRYINRLSDYLFVLAKKINFITGYKEKIWRNSCE